MKVNPIAYGILEIIAENDAERVWLGMMLCDIEKNHRPFLSHYISVDLEDSCRLENGKHARHLAIDDVIQGDRTWGLVDKIRFCATGECSDEEVQRRIALLKQKPLRH